MEEWETLSNEYRSLEKLHQVYQTKLEEVKSLQEKCIKGISHQRYRVNIIKNSLLKLEKKTQNNDPDEKQRNVFLQNDLRRRKAQLYEMENILPKMSGTYLKIILGNINVSILDKNDKFRYKDEYEKFKLIMSLLALVLSIFNCLTHFNTMDLMHMFLLVWYYCTLTIRESILKVNGSRMKGWWRAHHFISTVLAGIMLIWPRGECYTNFRMQFMTFNAYISFVQYLQFMYQRGCLYRLKALGQSHNMDITIDGFQAWMWKGLGFLLPFLFVGYIWEFYHAYTLYHLSFHPSAEWHVQTLLVLFFILGLGNTFTTMRVIPEKLKERLKLKYRFTKLDKYFWNHKESKISFRNPETDDRRTKAAREASFKRNKVSSLNQDEEILDKELTTQVHNPHFKTETDASPAVNSIKAEACSQESDGTSGTDEENYGFDSLAETGKNHLSDGPNESKNDDKKDK